MMKIRYNYMGFSLIELLVAASIMAVTVVAVVSIARKSRDVQLCDKHRQEARAILNAQFEKVYGYKQYASIQVLDTVTTVIIDSRGGNPLEGTLYAAVDSTIEYASGTPVPVKKVSLAITWKEVADEDDKDSIFMTKWIAE